MLASESFLPENFKIFSRGRISEYVLSCHNLLSIVIVTTLLLHANLVRAYFISKHGDKLHMTRILRFSEYRMALFCQSTIRVLIPILFSLLGSILPSTLVIPGVIVVFVF